MVVAAYYRNGLNLESGPCAVATRQEPHTSRAGANRVLWETGKVQSRLEHTFIARAAAARTLGQSVCSFMYVMNEARIVLGGAATPVHRLMMALAWADQADDVIAREESETGPKMYGASPGSVSTSSMRR